MVSTTTSSLLSVLVLSSTMFPCSAIAAAMGELVVVVVVVVVVTTPPSLHTPSATSPVVPSHPYSSSPSSPHLHSSIVNAASLGENINTALAQAPSPSHSIVSMLVTPILVFENINVAPAQPSSEHSSEKSSTTPMLKVAERHA